MASARSPKIINDPVYGFIALRHPLALRLMDHPYMQRLRRIAQLGLSHYVYPGAVHNRFHHAIGAMHLMQEAIDVLRSKGIEISHEEDEAACMAILLHDVGHGPFSHALEHSIVAGVHHEDLSALIMSRLNEDLGGALDTAISIFNDHHPRRFLHDLVSSQLDMDRLDYLARDSFYSGVAEGKVGSERIIKMLHVVDNRLVIEEKGIYSIEKFLVARRLMYWQVYLHRTVLSAEHMLMHLLRRAAELTRAGTPVFATPALAGFLSGELDRAQFFADPEVLDAFCSLDDSDILAAMKVWKHHADPVLSLLAARLLSRALFRIELRPEPFSAAEVDHWIEKVVQAYGWTTEQAQFAVFGGTVENTAYVPGGIPILFKDGSLRDYADASDAFDRETVSRPVIRHFLCRPKELR